MLALCATAASAEQELPIYPGTVHTRIGNDLLINGSFYRLAYFKTKDSLRTVARHFHKIWKDDGYPTTVDGDGVNNLVVTAFFTREGLARSVVLRRHGEVTLGFSVLKDLWVKPKAKSAPPPLQLEGALFAADLHSMNEGGNNRSRTEVMEGDFSALRQQVLAQLRAKGYSLSREYGGVASEPKQANLEFTSPTKQVLVTLTEVDVGMVSVTQLELGAFGNQNTQLPSEAKKAKEPKP